MEDNMSENKYLYGEIENTAFIKAIGNSTMKNSKTASDIIDKLLNGEKKEIILDMSECKYMDSTFLGLIAKYAMEIKMKWNVNLNVLNPTKTVSEGLKQTGIEKFIDIIVSSDVDNVVTEEVKSNDFGSKLEKSKYILDMHKTLMNLNEENKETFKNVVDLMEKSIDSND